MLTHKRLRQVLSYDPSTGVFTRLIDRGSYRAGEVAGGFDGGKGYWRIGIDGQAYAGHRLAWFYVYGWWPTTQIDHRDTDKANNRWRNLREATNAQNKMNSPVRVDSQSGCKGVTWDGNMKRKKRWRAHITVNGQKRWLGYHRTKAEAIRARIEANVLHGEFGRL
jgi:hypothetical protein